MSRYSPTGDFEKLLFANEYHQVVADLLVVPEKNENFLLIVISNIQLNSDKRIRIAPFASIKKQVVHYSQITRKKQQNLMLYRMFKFYVNMEKKVTKNVTVALSKWIFKEHLS